MRGFKISIFFCLIILLTVTGGHAAATSLRILYVNDFHGYAEPLQAPGSGEKVGGMAFLAARVEALRREKPSLLLAAGDMIEGNQWAHLFQGKSVIELMNAMKFDAMVVGNHEFDFGQAVLRKRIAEARFPVLGANVVGLDPLKPYVIKEVSGLRVAVIGVVTPRTPKLTYPDNVAGLQFKGAAATVEKYWPRLRGRADLLVVLSHLGYPADLRLAEKVPAINVIVGGHTHTRLVKPSIVDGVIIVQAWAHARALGVLDLTVDAGKIVKADGRLEDIKPIPGQEDPGVQKIVEKYRLEEDAVLGETVGEAAVDLDGEHVRARETNLGDLVADIVREKTGTEIALINGGAIRAGIPKGPITLKEVYEALPFNNYLVAFKLGGADLKAALEHGVSAVEKHAGRFPQVSGLSFAYSPGAPAGSRVRDVQVGGRALEPDGKYTVATLDFLAAGGDGYRIFGTAAPPGAGGRGAAGKMGPDKVVYNAPGQRLRDVVIDYLKAHGKVAPETQGRIRAVK
jgi:2',3'-cyclic-nucleotide 2'-phosphodiesterase (5'-nucleotidase family)